LGAKVPGGCADSIRLGDCYAVFTPNISAVCFFHRHRRGAHALGLRRCPAPCTPAAKAQSAEKKKTLLDNNDPNFVNPKEKLYDKFPLTVHQMDIIIGVLFALILLFLVLGMTHTSFFGLFGG